jgi:hypothetical protein
MPAVIQTRHQSHLGSMLTPGIDEEPYDRKKVLLT